MQSKKSRTVILIGFGTLVGFIILIASAGFAYTMSKSSDFRDLSAEFHEKAYLSYDMRLAARERLTSLILMSNLADPFARDTEMLRFNRIGTRFATARIKLESFPLSDRERELLNAQAEATKEVRPIQDELIDIAFAGDFVRAQKMLAEQLIPAQNRVIDSLKELRELQDQLNNQAVLSYTRQAEHSYVLFMSLLALSTVIAGAIIGLVVVRQITGTEQALFREKERYSLAVRGANDGLWDWDLVTNEVYFSPRWKDMLGYEEHEIPNKLDQWFNRIHPDDAEEALARLNTHLNGHSYYFESMHRLKTKQGEYRWFLDRGLAIRNEEGKAYRIAGSQTDVTEQKAREELLRTNEQRMRTVLDNVLEGIVTTDSNGLIESTNNAAEALLGMPDESAVGHNLREYLPDNHKQAYSRFLSEQQDGSRGEDYVNREIAITEAGGRACNCDLTISTMKVDDQVKLLHIFRTRREVGNIKTA